MELSQLRYFIAVAEMGNMSKAADALFVSQPNLSTSISRLEEEIGVPLFDRRRGKIALNQNGARLLESVKDSIDILDTGIQMVRDQYRGQAAPLSLACMTDDTDMLERFVLENPDINLVQKRVDLPDLTALLERDEVDLALSVLPPLSETIAYERIYTCRFVLLVNRSSPLASEPAISRKQMSTQHLAIDGSRVNKQTFYAAETSKFGMTPIIDYDVRHLNLLVSLVESNKCISIVPSVKYEELYLQGRLHNVVCKEYADGAPEAYWGIAYNKRRPLSEQGLRFRAFVKEYFEHIDAEYAAMCQDVGS